MPDAAVHGLLHALARLAHRPAQLQVAVPQDVRLRDAHQDRRQRDGLQARRGAGQRVAPGVVAAAGSGRQRQPPVAVGGGERQRRPWRLRHALLGHGARLAAEERLYQDGAPDGQGGQRAEVALPEPRGDVEGDAGARAVAHEEHAVKAAAGPPPREVVARRGAAGLVPQPPHGGQTVVERGGQAVLGRQAVVHGHHGAARARGELREELVVAAPGRGPDAEPAAVEVHHDGGPAASGSASRGRRRRHRRVQTRPHPRGGVDHHVPRDDATRRVRSGAAPRAGHGRDRREALDVSVLVDADQAVDLLDDGAVAVLGDDGCRLLLEADDPGLTDDVQCPHPPPPHAKLPASRAARQAEAKAPSCFGRAMCHVPGAGERAQLYSRATVLGVPSVGVAGFIAGGWGGGRWDTCWKGVGAGQSGLGRQVETGHSRRRAGGVARPREAMDFGREGVKMKSKPISFTRGARESPRGRIR